MTFNPVPKPKHKRRVPKQAKRNEFKENVRKRIFERDNGICQECGRRGEEIHHVVFRSRGGRGVFTNGLTLCNSCHRRIHLNNDLANKWIGRFKRRYGNDFYKDEWDKE